MPSITALLHTGNDARRLSRTLETLLPCSEVLIVDHSSTDNTLRVARKYGARIVQADSRGTVNQYLDLARHEWILCLEPTESITEALQATLFEWSLLPDDALSGDGLSGDASSGAAAFSLSVREQIGNVWHQHAAVETRLIPRSWTRWNGYLPAPEPSSVKLEGELLRLAFP
jgi:glycosyltransferase involved in cell wall biosynthesis